MSVFNGEKLKIEIWGESHAKSIGVKIQGIPKGLDIDEKKLQEFMDRRRAKKAAYSTSRIEGDRVIFECGVKDGKTDGEELSARIDNENTKSRDYDNLKDVPRPSHADYPARAKFGKNYDFRGGGQFSGRLTAPMAIAGFIAKSELERRGISVNAYISSIGKVKGESYKKEEIEKLKSSLADGFPAVSESSKALFMSEIENAKKEGDSVGGVIECIVTGISAGVGNSMFESIESKISAFMFGIPAVKGIEFGEGFDITRMRGSEANDELFFDENKNILTKTNSNGGINGGISNGMPILLRVAIKPTPSIAKEQNSINLQTGENVKLIVGGRHDSCIVPRAVPVVESAVAIAIFDCMGEDKTICE